MQTQFSWTHYNLFLNIKNESKRLFYHTETHKNNRRSRQLVRQLSAYPNIAEKIFINHTKKSLSCLFLILSIKHSNSKNKFLSIRAQQIFKKVIDHWCASINDDGTKLLEELKKINPDSFLYTFNLKQFDGAPHIYIFE